MEQLIHIGIPRTGSGSVRDALGDYILFNDYGRDKTSTWVRWEVTRDVWENAFKFSFVRNPITRFISAYATLPFQADEAKKRGDMEEIMTYNESLFIPQTERLKEELDFIGRFENIKEDWNKLLSLIGIEATLEHANKAESFRKKEPLTPKMEKWVREYYADDFRRFNYE